MSYEPQQHTPLLSPELYALGVPPMWAVLAHWWEGMGPCVTGCMAQGAWGWCQPADWGARTWWGRLCGPGVPGLVLVSG